MRIARIRINHLPSPMGVEGKPVFSWINEGFVQKSYRITVSSGNDILWDSGIVMDPCHSSVEYEGSPLPSLSECTLTIEADGVKGTSTFVTGCPELGERSSWIHDDSSPRYDLPTFVVSGNLNGRMHRSKGFSEAVYLKKDFRLWKFHLDHRALFQLSSNPDVMPLPMLALDFRYYLQFDVVKNVMQMQIGADGRFTTKWYAPAYNPALGVFHRQ